jgi:16S rRNA processing protein RimM
VSDDKVAIAFINKCWGIKGEVIAESLTRFPRRFEKLEHVNVSGTRFDLDLTIESVRKHGNKIVIKFREINDRDEARRLSNSYIQVSKTEIYELPAGNYYHFQLVGLEVIDSDNKILGKIEEILEYPASDIFVVRSEKGKLLIPAIKEVVKKIDLKQKRMEVELLPGMEFEAG